MTAPALLRTGRASASAAGIVRLRGRRLYAVAVVAVDGDAAGRPAHEAALVTAMVNALAAASGGTTARMRAAVAAADAALRQRSAGRPPAERGLTAAVSLICSDGEEAVLAQAGPTLAFVSTPDGLPLQLPPPPGADPDDPARAPLGRAGHFEPIIRWSRWEPGDFPRGLSVLAATDEAAERLSPGVVGALFATPLPRWEAALAAAAGGDAPAVALLFRPPAPRPSPAQPPVHPAGPPAVDAVTLGRAGTRPSVEPQRAPAGPAPLDPNPLGPGRAGPPGAARAHSGRRTAAAAASTLPPALRRAGAALGQSAARVPWRAIGRASAAGAARLFLALFPRRLASRDRTEWSQLLAMAAVLLPILVIAAALAILARQPGGLGAGFDRGERLPAPGAPAGGDLIAPDPSGEPVDAAAEPAAAVSATVPVATLAPLDPALDAGMVRLVDAAGTARLQGGDGDARRVVAVGDAPFVLNVAAGVVEAATAAGVLPVLQQGGTVAGERVGDLIDLAWLPRAGGGGGQVAALDAQGHLWAIEGIAARPLAVAGGLAQGTRAIGGYDGSLYGVDTANGITRYAAEPGPSFGAAEPWLAEAQDLSGAIDIAIDGSVYILLPGGAIERFAAGERAAFAADRVPGTLNGAVGLYASPTAGRVLVADAALGRIAALGGDGTFQAQLALPILPAAAPGTDSARGRIAALADVFWDEDGAALWWLSGPELYKAPYRR